MNELKSQMKPFKFMKRDEERKLLRMCHSSPDIRDFTDASPKPKPFKAKPVPKNLFSSYVYKKMREDEYYR
jgi:protein FAM161A